MIFPPAVSGAVAAYEIEKSLRFRKLSSGYLSRTPSIAGDRKKLAMRFRIKRAELGSAQTIVSAGTSSFDRFYFDASDRLCLDVLGTTRLVTTAVFRDPTNWYVDVGFELDVANGTATSRAKILVDGAEVSSYSTDTRSAITNTDTNWNNTVVHYIGRYSSGDYFDGYMSDPVASDGTTSITYSSGASSARDPVLPQTTYGTNGFYLPFSNGTSLSTLTADASGNGNNWTANNISLTVGPTYDWMEDTPTNNFAVLNSALNPSQYGLPGGPASSAGTIANANLRIQGPSGAWSGWIATVLPSTGKWYWEISVFGGLAAVMGIVNPENTTSHFVNTGFALNDVLGFALDRDAGTFSWYKNGVFQATITTGLSGKWYPYSTVANLSVSEFNFGQRPFAYTPPTGHQKLCAVNLTDTTVTTSGTFTGNASADGPFVWLNGVPTAMTINGNAVTFATHADKLANGFKVRSSSASYNAAGSNTYSITSTGAAFKNARAQVNP